MEQEFDIKRYHAYTGHLASKAMEKKAKNGLPIGCAPVGYRNVWTEEGKRIEVEPRSAPLIKRAFQLATKKRSSIGKILKQLTAEGLVSRNGTPMVMSALYRLLTNPFYTGKLPYKGAIHQGIHTPLVTQKTFDLVQEQFTKRRKWSVIFQHKTE